MKWITREHAKVDRIACPWLIKHFVDNDAVFLFVPANRVFEVAKEQQAIPFDIPNVELGHHGYGVLLMPLSKNMNWIEKIMHILNWQRL